jgi:hypothetical protein
LNDWHEKKERRKQQRPAGRQRKTKESGTGNTRRGSMAASMTGISTCASKHACVNGGHGWTSEGMSASKAFQLMAGLKEELKTGKVYFETITAGAASFSKKRFFYIAWSWAQKNTPRTMEFLAIPKKYLEGLPTSWFCPKAAESSAASCNASAGRAPRQVSPDPFCHDLPATP